MKKTVFKLCAAMVSEEEQAWDVAGAYYKMAGHEFDEQRMAMYSNYIAVQISHKDIDSYIFAAELSKRELSDTDLAQNCLEEALVLAQDYREESEDNSRVAKVIAAKWKIIDGLTDEDTKQ